MTGKDLILYILQNNLENEELFVNGVCTFLMTEQEAAAAYDVGFETIKIMDKLGLVNSITIGGVKYFSKIDVPKE